MVFLLIVARLLYNVALVSAEHECGSATCTHMSPPCWACLPPPPFYKCILMIRHHIFATLCMPAKSLRSCPTLCGPRGLQPARLLCPRDFPGRNTGVGSLSLLQGIFPTQGSNPGLLHHRRILYRLSHNESNKSNFPVTMSRISCQYSGSAKKSVGAFFI